jgi:hypothetical protein
MILKISVTTAIPAKTLAGGGVTEAEENDTPLLKALVTPPPARVFAGMAVVTLIFSIIGAWLSDEMVDRVVASPAYVGDER